MPAVIIDCAAALVIAANAGGLAVVGLTPADRLPAALDSAMPAVNALRDIVKSKLRTVAGRPLVFWRHGRTSAQLCDISSPYPDAPCHLCVVFRPATDAFTPAVPTIPDEPLADNDDAPPRIVRNDSETLKEIARRIREGATLRLPDSETTAPSIDPFSASPIDGTIIPATAAPLSPPFCGRPREYASSSPPSIAIERFPATDLATLAHELKTPLSAIAAAAEIMRDEQLGAMGNTTYLGYAADIHDSATHALAVIAGMLLARPSEDKRDYQPPAKVVDAFDLSDLAERTVAALQPLATQCQLTLGVDADPDLMPVRANPTAIRQILFNLLTNALKFTPAGGNVRAVTGYSNDGSIFLVVRDTGDGMTENAIAHALENGLENGDQTTAVRPGGGRGIGLRLVRRLAAENSAEFEIDTTPGKGTAVMITFAKTFTT